MIDTDKYFTHPLLSITQDKVVELQAEVKRLRAILDPGIKDIEIYWGIDFNGASITVTHDTGVMLSGELTLELIE